MDEEFCLKWNDYQSNVVKSFTTLRYDSDLSDVTLVSDDHKHITSHRVVLSTSSSYFKEIFTKNKHSHPMLCLSGVTSQDINNVLDYIYNGEVKINEDNLKSFLEIANRFKLEGLMDQNLPEDTEDFIYQQETVDYAMVDVKDCKVSTPIKEDNKKMQARTISTFQTSMISDVFESMDELNQTIAENMSKGSDGMWSCSRCPRVSKKKDHMTEHVESHLSGLLFQCQNCDKTSRSRQSLRHHKCRSKY